MITVALDLGTNTFRWLAVDDGRELGRGREVVGLGRGLKNGDRIAAAEIAAAEKLLAAWRPGAGTVPAADRVAAVGTHALRAAANGREVADRLGAALGHPIRIIGSELEAALTFAGVGAALPAEDGPYGVLDIGGGSTELAWGEGTELAGSISLPVGVVTQMSDDGEPLDATLPRVRQAVAEAYSHVYNEGLAALLGRLGLRRLASNCGTSSALALLASNADRYERDRIHGHAASAAWLRSFLRDHAGWMPADWATIPFVGSARCKLIGPGTAILDAFLTSGGFPAWTNSEAGLLEGLARHPEHLGKGATDPC